MTFSFNRIGNLGHLGNQMFQYAATKGFATKHNRNFIIAPKDIFGKYYYTTLKSSIDDCFNIQAERGISDFPIHEERFFHFDKEIFENPPEHDVDFLGYFQSEKYFKHIEEDIRKDFSFKPEIVEECLSHLKTLGDEVISLHIRRDDYLNLQSHHPNVPLKHYEVALSKFPDLPVLIFSDDPEWCSNQQLFAPDRFNVSLTKDVTYDMCLMSLCKYHIIANSSFSWWGAWLSNSKNVIAPKIWFGPSLPDHNTSDLYCPGWEVL